MNKNCGRRSFVFRFVLATLTCLIFQFVRRGGKLPLHGESGGSQGQSFHQPNKASTRSDVEDCDADRQEVRKECGVVSAANVRQPKVRANLHRLVLVDFGRAAVSTSRWVLRCMKWNRKRITFDFLSTVRVMDCYFHEGIKVLYRVALAILILFHKHTTQNPSEWTSDSIKNDIDNAIPKFCKQIPVSPLKLMRTAFNIRALRWEYFLIQGLKTFNPD